MQPIARIDMDLRSPEEVAAGTQPVDCYVLQTADLDRFAGVIIPPTVDQEHLLRHRTVIADYLDRGGVVVFGGHLRRPWLPGASPFVPLAVRSFRDYEVAWVAAHPVFAGVQPADLTRRRGVAGFFARGHHPPPPGAEILTRLAGGHPATYVDTVSTAGAILVQATCDLQTYAAGLDSTAARIPRQLHAWIRAEADRRARVRTAQR